ncbi:MAG: hypothetical protein GY861_27170, partial [bacterium]|nr:hypothetical protein [bacterium]
MKNIQRISIIVLTILLLTLSTDNLSGQNTNRNTSKSKKSEYISIQLKDLDITEVFRTLSERSGLNIVTESGVKGRVTVFLDDVRIEEALDIITTMNNLAYVKDGKTVMVYTEQKYEQLYGKKFKDTTKMKVFHLKHVQVSQVTQQLSTVKSKEGRIIADPRTNSLIVYDLPRAISEIEEIITVLDVPVVTKSYKLNYTTPSAVQTVISSSLSPSGTVVLDEAGSKIIITDSESNIQLISKIINEYDSTPITETRTYILKHATVKDVLPKVTSMVTQNVGTIQSDDRTNSLIITDLPRNLQGIESTITAFDLKTQQVIIEAKIMQVSLDDNRKMGVNWEAVSDEIDNVSNLTAVGRFSILAPNDDGLFVSGGDLEADDYTAVVEMLEVYGETNLLSSPRLVVTDKTEASLLVGSTIPYKTVDTREDNGSIRTFEKISMIDVGIKLFVTPEINSDSMITMKISPEVSSVVGYSENIPIVEKSELGTVVMVKNGVTI